MTDELALTSEEREARIENLEAQRDGLWQRLEATQQAHLKLGRALAAADAALRTAHDAADALGETLA